MKAFIVLTTLAALVAGRPLCSRPKNQNTPVYTNTTVTNTPSPTSNTNSTSLKAATGWYPGWYGDKFPPSQVPWEKYTALTYAFV